jgi:hypothetical protein
VCIYSVMVSHVLIVFAFNQLFDVSLHSVYLHVAWNTPCDCLCVLCNCRSTMSEG